MSRCASRKDVGQVRRERSSTRKPRRVRKKGGLARSFGLRRGQEDQRSQAAHPGRHVGSPVERCRSSRRRSRPRWSIPSVAPGTPTVPLHQAHLCRRWLCGREDGARRVAHRDMEAGDCEATRCHRFRDLVQKMDRRKDIRLDQPQSSPSPRFRTLRHNSCRVRPLGHDPHHAKAACCRKLLGMNPNLPDGLLVLGGVFLCVTGAEALYADMGHFGKVPIRRAWNFVVFPSLVLNYAGQAAIVVEGAPTQGNIFYHLCPSVLLTPLVVLATIATIIASQSIITGAFSMTRQAIALGWMPRLRVIQTSEEGYGQIYVGAVNWLLMIATLGLTIIFRRSDNLAAAYGIAVSLTMLLTSVLLFIAMREIWGWSPVKAGAVALMFLVVDFGFFTANVTKVLEGGYVPLLLAVAVYGIMWIWHRGTSAVRARVLADQVPLKKF